MKSYKDLRFEVEAAYGQAKRTSEHRTQSTKNVLCEFDLLLITHQLERGAGVAMQRMRSRSIYTLRIYWAP